jgi:DNA polymerase-3 subunit delta'
MLPTIVSRCRHIRFNPIPVSRLAQELVESCGMDIENAHALAVISGGSLSKARELPRSNWINRRKWLLESFSGFLPPWNEEQEPSRLFAMASVLCNNKEQAVDSLEILKTIYRDILIFKYQPDNLLNPDVVKKIAAAADHLEEEDIMTAIKAIDMGLDRIRSNANVRLTLESLFLRLQN